MVESISLPGKKEGLLQAEKIRSEEIQFSRRICDEDFQRAEKGQLIMEKPKTGAVLTAISLVFKEASLERLCKATRFG
jgi:hypothetical protein